MMASLHLREITAQRKFGIGLLLNVFSSLWCVLSHLIFFCRIQGSYFFYFELVRQQCGKSVYVEGILVIDLCEVFHCSDTHIM